MNPYIKHYLHLRSNLKAQRVHRGEYELKSYNQHNCIFVHIPKTGGVAVSRCLFGSLGGGHRNLQEYKEIFGPIKFRKYFKFCIVRNPVDRLVSAYNFIMQGGMSNRDARWRDENLTKYNGINEFIKNGLEEAIKMKKYHFVPQVDFIVDNNGIVGVNYIARFEQLGREVKNISELLGIKGKALKHQNKSKKVETNINPTSIEIIRELYKDDYLKIGFDG